MKKIKYILLASMITFLGMLSVNAQSITVENIAKKFNEYNVSVDTSTCKGSVKAEKDSNNKLIIKCSSNSDQLLNFVYDSNQNNLSYTRPEDNLIEGTVMKDVDATFKILDNVLEAILSVSGNENISLPEDLSIVENNNSFSIAYKYSLSASGLPNSEAFIREGKVLEKSGDISSIVMTLDTDKIKNMIDKYGDRYIRQLLEKTPTISAGTIKHNSVAIKPTVEGTPTDSANYKASCYLYRATTNSDDAYELIDTPENCLTGVTLVDNTVKPSTNYYYKIQLVGSSHLSETLNVTTEATPVTPDVDPTPDPDPDVNPDVTPDNTVTPDGGKENPNTGVFVPSVVLSLFAIGGVATLIYTNNKNRFKNY